MSDVPGREKWEAVAVLALMVFMALALGLALGWAIFQDDGWSQEDVWDICASGVIDECTIEVTP